MVWYTSTLVYGSSKKCQNPFNTFHTLVESEVPNLGTTEEDAHKIHGTNTGTMCTWFKIQSKTHIKISYGQYGLQRNTRK